MREEYGKVIQTTAKCCGPEAIFTILMSKLKTRIDEIQRSEPHVADWSHIETILYCISELASVLT